MSYRTLKFGDRTISYDAGLNSLSPTITFSADGSDGDHDAVMGTRKKPASPDPQNDDGIGSSDDEGSGASSNASSSSRHNSMEDSKHLSLFECDSSPNLAKIARKKVIKPDPSAINQLLAFDEEEEDDLDEDEDQNLEEENQNQNSSQTGWQRTIVKDLANLSPSHGIQRRHSISICESKRKNRKSSSTSSSSGSSKASSSSNSPKNSRCENSDDVRYQLNVNEMHASLNHELGTIKHADKVESSGNPEEALQTLSLNLDEVVHIRSVLTKAELEALPIDGNVRSNVENGRVCFLCMKTRFGLFTRGHKCEMCKQIVCYRCHSKMKIPTEHFSNTPVFTLSPTHVSPLSGKMQQVDQHHDLDPHKSISTTCRDKKLSLPISLGLLGGAANSVGSAPNSPSSARKNSSEFDGQRGQGQDSLSTISGKLGDLDSPGLISLPPVPYAKKYNTLPTKNRRMSWVSPRHAEREKLEGSLLTICTDCKDMVLQVIRASRTSKRIQMVKSMFTSLNPDTTSR